jgi:hypothetical protein
MLSIAAMPFTHGHHDAARTPVVVVVNAVDQNSANIHHPGQHLVNPCCGRREKKNHPPSVVSSDRLPGTKTLSVSLQIDIFGSSVEFASRGAILGTKRIELPVRDFILAQTVRQSRAYDPPSRMSTIRLPGTKVISVSLQIDIFGIPVEFYGPCAILGTKRIELPGAILNIGPNGTPV